MSLVNKLKAELGSLESEFKIEKRRSDNAMKADLELFRQKRAINYEYDLKLLERRFELEKELVLFKHELNN